MSDVTIKEAMDLVAFNDEMHKTTQSVLLKKLKTLYPELYKEWHAENVQLINKWSVPA